MKKAILFIASLILLAIVSGCKSKQDSFLSMLNHNGQADSFRTVKKVTNVPGYMVIQDTTTGQNFAVFYGAYEDGMSMKEYLNRISSVWGVDYVPLEVSQSGSDYVGGGYTFEDSTTNTKDLETLGAELQASNIASLRKTFMSQFGLSMDRAQEVARLISSWNEFSKRHEVTSQDMKNLSTAILGADIAQFQKAAIKAAQTGNSADIDNLTQQAAATNGISVEHARSILKTFLNY